MPTASEPRILTADVQRIISGVIHPDNEDFGEAVTHFAARADTSTRTVYRVLGGTAGEATSPPSLMLSLADRLVTAAGRHLMETRALVNGEVRQYLDVP